MKYRPVQHVGFTAKRHRQLLWLLNAIAKAKGEEVAVTAKGLIEKAGREELDRLGVGAGGRF